MSQIFTDRNEPPAADGENARAERSRRVVRAAAIPDAENPRAERSRQVVRAAATPDAEDPRVERSRRVVRQAALEELAERGWGGFSVESVAARARVGRSTVYRHWIGKLDLIADALESLNVQPAGHAGGTAIGRERVEEILLHLAQALGDSRIGACLPALVEAAGRDPAVRSFLHAYSNRRRAGLVEAIAASVPGRSARADLDPEAAATALAGALFYRRLITAEPADQALITSLLDTVLGPSPRRREGWLT